MGASFESLIEIRFTPFEQPELQDPGGVEPIDLESGSCSRSGGSARHQADELGADDLYPARRRFALDRRDELVEARGLPILTTEKDRARLSGAAASAAKSDRVDDGKIVRGQRVPRLPENALADLAARARVLPVRLVVGEEAAFRRLVLAKVQAAR